jgi:hypothetical protein
MMTRGSDRDRWPGNQAMRARGAPVTLSDGPVGVWDAIAERGRQLPEQETLLVPLGKRGP